MPNHKNTSFHSWMVVCAALCLSIHISGCTSHEQKAPNWLIERLGGENQWLNSPESIKFAPLSKTPVIDADLKYLGRLSGVQKIWLSDTNITGTEFPQLTHLQELQGFYLQRTKITDESLKHLAKIVRFSSFTRQRRA